MAFDYDKLEAGYYDKAFRRRRGVQSKWHHLKFEHVRAVMGPFADHLDVACGPGTFIGTLEGPGRSVGVDISAAQIEYARSNYETDLHSFRLIQPGQLPFADESFDIVTMLELIEHVSADDGGALLRDVRRVLRPGGRVVMTTPNYRGLWPVLEMLVDRLGKVQYSTQHISHYHRGSLGRLLSSCGFRVELLERHMLTAPFAACLGWRVADWVDALEPKFITRSLGHLLIAKGIKNAS